LGWLGKVRLAMIGQTVIRQTGSWQTVISKTTLGKTAVGKSTFSLLLTVGILNGLA